MLFCNNVYAKIINLCNKEHLVCANMCNEAGEEKALKAGDFALVNPDEKHQHRNKEDKPLKMICGVPKEYE